MNRMSLSPLSCKRESYVGGSPTIPLRCFCQYNLKCMLLLIAVEQSKLYMSSCEVFIKGVSRAVRFSIGPRVRSRVLVDYLGHGIEVYSPRLLPSRSLTDLRSWHRGSNSAKDCGVNSQPALDRGGTSILCGLWD
jgi:hypothetical protein